VEKNLPSSGYLGPYTMGKKPYTAPRMVEYLPDEVPEWVVECFQNDLSVTERSRPRVAPVYTTLVDGDRKYVRVSDSFCELLGYKSEELIGKRFDEITAPATSDIPVTFSLFKKFGYTHGLWMFVHRTGKRILIRYESWLRPDSFIETNIEVVDHPC
jgi:PAS domain S-box-containing protein